MARERLYRELDVLTDAEVEALPEYASATDAPYQVLFWSSIDGAVQFKSRKYPETLSCWFVEFDGIPTGPAEEIAAAVTALRAVGARRGRGCPDCGAEDEATHWTWCSKWVPYEARAERGAA